MTKKAFLILAAMALAAAPVAAAAPAPAPTVADVLPVCEQALAAAIGGHDAHATVEDNIKGLPEEQRQAVLAICGVYIAGAVSMLKHIAPTVAPAADRKTI